MFHEARGTGLQGGSLATIALAVKVFVLDFSLSFLFLCDAQKVIVSDVDER